MILERILHRDPPAMAADIGEQPETIWVEATQRGDSRAFNRLVMEWERAIYNLARRMLGNEAEAEEATQEIFLSAYRHIHQFRLGARFSTWLYRIAVNHCISQLRRRSRRVYVSLDDPLDTGDPPPVPLQLQSPPGHETELFRAESQRQVRSALKLLSPDHRAVVELKFYQDLTFEQIAEIVACPVGTVKSRFYAGLNILKDRLGD